MGSKGRFRATLGDRNRKFVLLCLVYPAILGTIIWEFIGKPFELLTWSVALLLAFHFTLDFIYLKLNLEYHGAEDSFRYGWSLFTIDLGIVVLIRLAFTTLDEMVLPSSILSHPYSYLTGVYVLYVIWEIIYARHNPIQKKSPETTPKHYAMCCTAFLSTFVLYLASQALCSATWLHHATNVIFVTVLLCAVGEHFWSVFLRVKA